MRLLNPVLLKTTGWSRVLRGLRAGDQSLLITGLGMLLFRYLRSSKPQKELIFRKVVPVGSTVVVRHAKRGDPRIEIRKPGQTL